MNRPYQVNPVSSGEMLQRELYFANLFRLLEATVYAGLAFSPLAVGWIRLDFPLLANSVSIFYLVFATATLVLTRHPLHYQVNTAVINASVDVVAMVLMITALSDARIGIAMMLLVNIGAAAAVLLSLRGALIYAGAAAVAILLQSVFEITFLHHPPQLLLAPPLFGLAYIASAWLNHTLGRQIRAAAALAERRGIDLANLSQVNELIIRRMKTGVLLVDEGQHIHQMNESAWLLLGSPPAGRRDLGRLAPELSRRLYHWLTDAKIDVNAVTLAEGVPEVVPRFTHLAANDDSHTLIFLDDTSLVSRRAEEMTLASLGRLSASIAHEIRNPLAAIRYSAQLLNESPGLNDEDTHLVGIINNHCVRLNDIIENILQLSRRDRSRPEVIDLNDWVLRFIEEYSEANDLGEDSLHASVPLNVVEATVDIQHLQQVVWNLVQNAMHYGRSPGEPACVRVIVRYASEHGPPLLEVIDRGPGIPPKVAAKVFEPFFTTHELGTGLGLYLAKQMCEVNQANLEYVPISGGGSCFRITLAAFLRMAVTA